MSRVYLASPLGFTEPGRFWVEGVLVPAVRAAGWTPLDPFADNPAGPQIPAALALPDHAQRLAALRDANLAVGRGNVALIRSADALLALLDGPDVDSGTAAEIGFAAALGIRCVGLRTDLRTSGDNEGSCVNLQIETFIEDSGGSIHHELAAALAALRSG